MGPLGALAAPPSQPREVFGAQRSGQEERGGGVEGEAR